MVAEVRSVCGPGEADRFVRFARRLSELYDAEYMDAIAGVYFPRGGVFAVSEELAALAGRVGVDLRLHAPVAAIEVHGGRATGVRTAEGEQITADAVVCTRTCPWPIATCSPPA